MNDPQDRTLRYHNPDNLPSAGEPPWRFLVEGEEKQEGDEYNVFNFHDGNPQWYPVRLKGCVQGHVTYRTLRPLSTKPEREVKSCCAHTTDPQGQIVPATPSNPEPVIQTALSTGASNAAENVQPVSEPQETAIGGSCPECGGQYECEPWCTREDKATPSHPASGTPKVVCLCGSSKYPQEHMRVMMEETLAGRIVIPMGLYGHADFPTGARAATNDGDEATEVKQMLDQLHWRKIDVADEIVVVTVGGYFGSSTKREIEYAQRHGKLIRYRDFPQSQPASGTGETPRTDEREFTAYVTDSTMRMLECKVVHSDFARDLERQLIASQNIKASVTALADKEIAELQRQLSEARAKRDEAMAALKRMVDDKPNAHLCDNDGMGCPACELAQETLDKLK